MHPLRLILPRGLVFGLGSRRDFLEEASGQAYRRVLVVTAPPVAPLIQDLLQALRERGVSLQVLARVDREPDTWMLQTVLREAHDFGPDCVLGVGGGSALDVAKLAAALYGSDQTLDEIFGTSGLRKRTLPLVCMPTTAGTGSEVSPNAVLLDPSDGLKKAAVSPYLIPDAVYVDPELTVTLPPETTAGTAFDALTHCIEVYTNRFAHPLTDAFALEGVRLIAKHLTRAIRNGHDLEARSALALGSLYGGFGLGPVNTAAVHALAYPLASRYKIPHGLSNAVLLPYVMAFNAEVRPERYAEIARVLGVQTCGTDVEVALAGAKAVWELLSECGLPRSIRALNVLAEDLPELAEQAIAVTRLLKNNPRDVAFSDALTIYQQAYKGELPHA